MTTSSDNTARPHLAYLDGLRALAAFWVVLSHLWISQFGLPAHSGLLGLATNWTLYSHFAVDIFIVLSGYCLMLPVTRDNGLRGGASKFYKRRARRILPPFYAALLFSIFASLLLRILARQPVNVDPHALLANVLLIQDLSPKWNIFNGPFWSIAVEWRIYFLFPMMVWVAARWGQAPLLTLSALAGYGLTWPLLAYHSEMSQASPWYLPLFTLGVCAASEGGLHLKNAAGWAAGLSGLSLAALLYLHPVTLQNGADFGRYMPITDGALGVFCASALALLSRHELASGIRTALSWHPLATLGTFAYSFYLVHMPCILILNNRLNYEWPALTPFQRFGLLAALGLPLILALSYLFFLAFERPFLTRPAASSRIDAGKYAW